MSSVLGVKILRRALTARLTARLTAHLAPPLAPPLALHLVASALFGLQSGLRAAPAEHAAEFASCAGETGGEGTVVEVIDAETLLLDDARVVRLIGALPPRFARQNATHGGIAVDLRSEITAALARLTLGKRVRLRFGGTREDRYGKLLAQVYVEPEGGEREWLQGAMVRAGLAVTYSVADNRACARELMEVERGAKERQQGFWRNGLFRIRNASDATLLLGLVNTYQIVKGVVTTVAEVGGRVYVNFGANYRDDFTLAIEKKDRSAFAGAPGALASVARGKRGEAGLEELKGKRVQARGWIQVSNGPMIAVTHPEQIEVVGEEKKGGD